MADEKGPSMGRRGFLAGVASAAVASTAGCSVLSDGEQTSTPTETTPTTTTTSNGDDETPTSTEVPSPELVAGKDGMTIEWSNDIDTVEEFPDRHKVEFQINTNT
ncbi:MAG: hypothetical protein ABEJ36_06150, partial [Candidatus Nanosalina sp.]